MISYLGDGTTIDYINGTGSNILAGEIIVIGEQIAVAASNIRRGKTGQIHIEGVLTGVPASTSESFVQGDALYWDGTKLTKTSTGNTAAGIAAAAKTLSATTASLKLQALTSSGGSGGGSSEEIYNGTGDFDGMSVPFVLIKNGSVVTFQLGTLSKTTSGYSYFYVASIPEQFRPIQDDVYLHILHRDGLGQFEVSSDGEIYIWNAGETSFAPSTLVEMYGPCVAWTTAI